MDMAQIMAMLSKMDKKELESGIALAQKILSNKENKGNL